MCVVGSLGSRLNVQKVRLAGCLRAPPRSWTLLLALVALSDRLVKGAIGVDVLDLAVELRRTGEAFALATVVRCERPTSAKPGAKARIRGDGAVTGWVGGACAEPVVVREALKALGDGQPRLVALVGEGGGQARRGEG